jgi:putative glutamine amidotransferase
MSPLDAPRILVTAAIRTTREEYCEAVRQAGGEPFVATAEAGRSLTAIDGLLLTGGGDVEPALYGSNSTLATEIDAARDAFESALLWKAREHGLPTLCICRGVQIANVAFGGSLIPDLAVELGPNAAVPHSVIDRNGRTRRDLISEHVVRIADGSHLAMIVQTLRLTTGARHHQSVDRCSDDLRVVGRTADGVVEALEATFDSPFWLAVQWHPESTRDLDDGASRRIFTAFAFAAHDFRERRRSGLGETDLSLSP